MSSTPTDAVVSLPHMNPTNAAVLKMVTESSVGKAMSDADRAALTQTLTTTDARDVQGWLGIQIRKAAAEGVALIKARGGLGQWFEEKWVDLSRPKEGGGFEPCGREEAESGNYPKCVPAAKAAKMTDAEIASAVRRKRSAEAESDSDDKKPVNVPTFTKAENVPTNPELYARVKAAAKKKFDVYPSAYANAWLVREYKSRGGEYRVEKGDYVGHPFRGNQYSDASGASTGGAGGSPKGGGKPKKRTTGLSDFNEALRQYDRVMAEEGKSKAQADRKRKLRDQDKRVAESQARAIAGKPNEDLEGLKASREQIINDLVNEEGMSRKKATNIIDSEIAAAGAPKGGAMMSGKAKVDTMFSESDNKKVATAFSAFIKDKKFPADHQITSAEIKEFADSLQGKVGSEITDTAVREQLAEQYHEQTGIPYKGRQSRDEANQAKRDAVREVRARETATREKREAAETKRRGNLSPLSDADIKKPLTGTEASEFRAGVKATNTALKETDSVIQNLRVKLSSLREKGSITQDQAQKAGFAIDEAQQATDRIRDAVDGLRKPTFGGAAILQMRSVNEAENVKGALREALSVTSPRGSSEPRGVASLQSAMDRDFGMSRTKYDVDGMDMDTIFDLSDSLGR